MATSSVLTSSFSYESHVSLSQNSAVQWCKSFIFLVNLVAYFFTACIQLTAEDTSFVFASSVFITPLLTLRYQDRTYAGCRLTSVMTVSRVFWTEFEVYCYFSDIGQEKCGVLPFMTLDGADVHSFDIVIFTSVWSPLSWQRQIQITSWNQYFFNIIHFSINCRVIIWKYTLTDNCMNLYNRRCITFLN